MGLLDDAIREHLDLKRRRGADPSEIAREEADALGPVRRDAPDEDDALAPAEHGSYPDHEPAALDEPGAAYDDDVVDFDRPVASESPRTHERPYAEREDESATPPHGDPLAHQQTREFSATELDDALGADEPAPAPPADAVPADDDEADADADAGADGDPDAEDELEDTPDFLQETPEHDRLWFEQKPPKDFDF
ncbi:MAG: hypothetical protein JWR63_3909 [Conexibacter sp.]|nr:hypothetical protein [Conexibacter sp.]